MIFVSFYSCQRTSTEPIDVSNQEPIIVINKPPVISSIVATPDSVQLGKTTTITCNASDPNGDSISYYWGAVAVSSSQTDGSYDFNWDIEAGNITGSGNTATWQAPLIKGLYVILCKILDIAGQDDLSLLEIKVVSTGCLYVQTDKLFYTIGDTIISVIENATDSTIFFEFGNGIYIPAGRIDKKVGNNWEPYAVTIFDGRHQVFYDEFRPGGIFLDTIPDFFRFPENLGTYRINIPYSDKPEYPLSDSLLSNTFYAG